MNEHLTNLYRSCRSKEALASQDQYKSANVLIGTEIEKFAELVVRECANICYGFGESGDGYTCSAEVLEHFGVEE